MHSATDTSPTFNCTQRRAALQHVVLCVPTALASLVTGGGRTDKLVKVQRRAALARSCRCTAATAASASVTHCRTCPGCLSGVGLAEPQVCRRPARAAPASTLHNSLARTHCSTRTHARTTCARAHARTEVVQARTCVHTRRPCARARGMQHATGQGGIAPVSTARCSL